MYAIRSYYGISHAGTLISAILRLSKAEWRRPITRMAEVITAIVLAIGGLHPIIDLGRPDRITHIFFNGRLQSRITSYNVCYTKLLRKGPKSPVNLYQNTRISLGSWP